MMMLKSLDDLPDKGVQLKLTATWGGHVDYEDGIWVSSEAYVFCGSLNKKDLARLAKIIKELQDR